MVAQSDIASLTVPRHERFLPLLRVFLGGIASRCALSLEAIDDLQIALDNVVLEDRRSSGDLTLEVSRSVDALEFTVGPLADPDLRQTLVSGSVAREASDRCLDVCLLLAPLVDAYSVRDLESGAFALSMRKSLT